MMEQWFGDNAIFFSIPALFGTTIFVLRMAMLLLGADDGGDLGGDLGGADAAGMDFDANSEPIDHGGTNPDSSFQLISFQTIAAFLMGAGWGGLGAYRGSGLELGWSMLIAFGCGLGMLYLFAWMMKALYDMQSSGNVTSQMIIGIEGLVDNEIPSSRAGQGTVKITVNDQMRFYNAVTEGPTLARGSSVQIIKINPDNTVTVTHN